MVHKEREGPWIGMDNSPVKKLFWRTGEYGVQVDITVLFCAWCGFCFAQTGAAPAQTGAALPRLVRSCADWCGPAQTGAAGFLQNLESRARAFSFWGISKIRKSTKYYPNALEIDFPPPAAPSESAKRFIFEIEK